MTNSTELRGLHQELRACRLCLEHGHDITAGAIFSGGAGAQVMTIGQAPGVTEVDAGRPFNAGSGTRLFDWLAQAGFEEAAFRRRQYMTSVTKCFPGKAGSGGGDRVPTRQEQALCRDYLDRELALVDPALVIPIGRLAINLYFPASRPLTKIIGTREQMDGRWIVPLPHPSGASRWHQLPENRRRIQTAIEHLAKLRRKLGIE